MIIGLGVGPIYYQAKKQSSGTSYLAYDTFTRADGVIGAAESGQTWDVSYSTTSTAWVVTSGKAAYTNASSGIAVIDSGTTNVRQTVKITFASNDGLVCRVQDGSNHYILRINTGSIALFRNASGTATSLSSYSFTPVVGQTYTIILECSGTTISGYVDGVKRVEALGETSFSTQTRHGLRSSSSVNGKYDDYYMEAM